MPNHRPEAIRLLLMMLLCCMAPPGFAAHGSADPSCADLDRGHGATRNRIVRMACDQDGVGASVADGEVRIPIRGDRGTAGVLPADADWHAFGGISGANGMIYRILPYRSGFVVAGDFTAIGDAHVNSLAYWDGSSWTDLGSGVSRSGFSGITALASDGDSLYIGGDFTLSVSPWCSFIARWDGSAWHDLGESPNGRVESLLWHNGALYAAGQFTDIGGVAASHLGRYDGTSWSGVGGGTDGPVHVLAAAGTDLYVGGAFYNVGEDTASPCVSRWDGSSWHAISNGMAGANVFDMRVIGSELIIGGDFSEIGGAAASGVARWDGMEWHAIGTGFQGTITALEVHDGRLYVTGGYAGQNGIDFHGIACWDGTSWSSLGSGMEAGPYTPGGLTMRSVGTDLLVSGNFYSVGGVQSRHLARWTALGWAPLQAQVGNGVESAYGVAIMGGKVYIGGLCPLGGMTRSGAVLGWDGSAWSPVGSLRGCTYTMSASASTLYWGGWDIRDDGTTAWSVWAWNGSLWTQLGTLNGTVNSVTPYRDGVAVGGSFSTVNGILANSVAYWDGHAWSSCGSGVRSDSYTAGMVHDLRSSGGDLYVAGAFWMAGEESAANVARWDGSAWSPLGGGLSDRARNIGLRGSDVYVSGDFTTAGGSTTVAGFARWDGASWHRMDGPAPAGPMVEYNGGLVVAGGALATASTISSWDGASWSGFGSGIAQPGFACAASAMAVSGSSLYVVGNLTSAGGRTSVGIARWSPDQPPQAITDADPAANRFPVGATAGSTVGVTALAVDPDGDRISYSLADDAGGVFSIDPMRGVVRVATPPTGGAYQIVVRATDGTLSSDLTITLEGRRPPVLAGVAPAASPTAGGTVVTISGSHLMDATSVTFGGMAASSLTVNTDTEVTAIAPPHAPGTVDIALSTPYGSSTLPSIFTYSSPAPVITSLAPAYGPITGATVVTITGTDVTGATRVTFGGRDGTDLSVLSTTSLTVITPPHEDGAVDVVVMTPSGPSAPHTFTYRDAEATSGSGSGDGGGGGGGCGTGALAMILASAGIRIASRGHRKIVESTDGARVGETEDP